MKIDDLLADGPVLTELGRRITETRLAANMTQADLALAAGVSKRTVERLEAGAGAQLANLVRCLRALKRMEGLDRLVPEHQRNPIDLLQHRADTSRARARPDRKTASLEPWSWGDDK